MNRPAVLFTILVLLGACSSADTTSGTTATDAGTRTETPGDSNVLAGTFQIKLASGATSFIGKVYDGASLSEVSWENSQGEDDCQLLVPRVPFCSTPCGGSSACVENDVCKPYPLAHSVGTVTLTGVKTTAGASSVTMSPVVNNYQPAGGTSLAFPPFAEGDSVRIEASGDYYAPFAIDAKGIAPLTMSTDALLLEKGKPAKLTWTAPTDPSLTKIEVRLDVSHHGGSKGKIECTGADDGELELSAALVSALLDLGVAGFPTIIVTRKSVGSTTIGPGRVDLVVASEIERAISIEGVTSCNDTSQCPEGKTCQSDLTCK